MEYPFKDLLPLDEVLEREGYYKDWTHLDPEVFYSLTQISEYIKTKGYGVDVRLLIAQLAEHFGLKTTQVIDLANLLQQKFDNLEGVTQSFTDNINSLVAQMEADKDAVIANATVDSEVILARGGEATLAGRLESDFRYVENKTSDKFVTLEQFGGVGDYILPDGTINPNPTDNSEAIALAFNVSNKIKAGEGRGYYFSQKISAPKNVEIDLKASTFHFENDGIDLGSGIWNKPRIYGGTISGIADRDVKQGRGLFTENGYIVYPEFDVEINHFEKGVEFVSLLEEGVNGFKSNCTWGKMKFKIEYCDWSLIFKGGWTNTVRLDVITNFIRYGIVFDSEQFHDVTFDNLVMERCATDEIANTSPFLIKNGKNGEITIHSAYVENNGFIKSAPPAEEVAEFKTLGQKVISPLYPQSDTKAYRLGDKIYAEDANQITNADIGYSATFGFEDCSPTVRLRVNNMYMYSNLLGLAGFKDSPVTARFNDIFFFNNGYSFQLTRKVFINNNSEKTPKISMRNVENEGGGSSLDYGGIDFKGDAFGLNAANNDIYSHFRRGTNQPIPTGTTAVVFQQQIGLGDVRTADSGASLDFTRSGLYIISGLFIVNSSAPKLLIRLRKSGGTISNFVYKNLDVGDPMVFNTTIFVEKDAKLEVEIVNSGSATELLGVNQNLNYLIVKRI